MQSSRMHVASESRSSTPRRSITLVVCTLAVLVSCSLLADASGGRALKGTLDQQHAGFFLPPFVAHKPGITVTVTTGTSTNGASAGEGSNVPTTDSGQEGAAR